MPNIIRPVDKIVAKGRRAVFEVEVDYDVEHFTWVITNNRNEVVDWGDQHRTRNEDTLTYSFFSKKALKQVGAYQLRLFNQRRNDIQRGSELPGRLGDADDSFVVKDSIPGQSGRAGDVLKVALTQDDHAPESVSDKMFPSFAGFRRAIAPKFDVNPDFGDGSYRSLRKLARQYVRQFDVRKFGDLVPKGYLKNRKQDTLQSLPLVKTGHIPAVELIWNYWQEQGMLVQTLYVILARFQNRHIHGVVPLARFDVTPLLPLRNKLWVFAEGEMERLTVRHRATEYEFEYGLSMEGRAIPARESNVERRSAFLSSFHQVVHLAHLFYKEFDDLTVQADAFPLYRALRDCHLVLSQGSQNQYGEMAVAARAEFLLMQAILAEPQMREFLGGRPMTPYPEHWMDRVDSMNSIQGWTDTSVMHFHDLATLAEQLVLSIRLGNWAAPNVDQTHALTWAQAFRSAVQKYAAAYRSATGVDLAREPNAEQPSVLLSRKASGQQLRA
jgi:hypothetical protein